MVRQVFSYLAFSAPVERVYKPDPPWLSWKTSGGRLFRQVISFDWISAGVGVWSNELLHAKLHSTNIYASCSCTKHPPAAQTKPPLSINCPFVLMLKFCLSLKYANSPKHLQNSLFEGDVESLRKETGACTTPAPCRRECGQGHRSNVG